MNPHLFNICILSVHAVKKCTHNEVRFTVVFLFLIQITIHSQARKQISILAVFLIKSVHLVLFFRVSMSILARNLARVNPALSVSTVMPLRPFTSKPEKNKPIKLTSLLNQHTNLYAKKKEIIDYKAVKFYDPPYINKKAPFPNYELLNINLHGYDYSVLDTFFRYLERLCTSLKIEVVEAYAMPCRNLKVKTYQPFSATLDREFKLNNYHRVVKIQSLKSTMAPLLFEAIQLNLPEGVQLNVTVPTEEESEFRYVPDIELNELKQKLEDSKIVKK